MYLPRHFEQNDPAALQALMREHPLATLVSDGDGGLTANHLPLEYDAAQHALLGHVARANPLWRDAGRPVLAVFNGPQAYITPAWYPGKAEHGKVVPTWNYAVVHVHGVLEVHEDAPWLHSLVSRLTDTHEAPRDAPWHVTDAPPDFVDQMLRAIVGIRIPVGQLIGKWKLSQNRPEADREAVAQGLQAQSQAAVAALVRAK